MGTIDPVVVPLNKRKLWWLSACCVLFIGLGFFFVLAPHDFKSPLIHNVFIIRILGFIALVLFGYFLGVYIPQITNKAPGLEIDEKGVTDHTTANSVGFIGWEDIADIHSQSITGQKFMVVRVKHPEVYIEKASGTEKRLLKGNLQLCGSPIVIPAAPLKCSFKQLESMLVEAFNQYSRK